MSLHTETIKSLRVHHFFAGLSKEEMHRVAVESKEKTLNNNQFVFKQGQEANYFYFLHSGQVKLTRLSLDGNEKVIDIIQPGRMFAEVVVLNETPGYPVNAEVLESSKIIYLHCSTFRKLLLSSPELCLKMMGEMSRRLHFLIKEVDRLTLHNASYRLVSYLLEHVKEYGGDVQLSVPKHVIASRISVKPETFSRILKQLSQAGLIKVNNNEISLVNIKALESLIEIDDS